MRRPAGPRRLGRPAVRAAVLGAAALSLPLSPAAGQAIRGTAMDSAGRPLAGVPVALHRIGGGAASSVATGASDERGRFSFELEAADSAVYFAAMRVGNRLYIGPPVRAGVQPVSGYELRADATAEAGAVASALAGRARPGPLAGAVDRPAPSAPQATELAVLVVLLGAAAATAFLMGAPRYREARRREALLELARIEAGRGQGGQRPDAEAEVRRARLRASLLPRS